MVKRYRGGLISATDYNENGLSAGSMFTLSDRAQIAAANTAGWFRPPPTIEYLVVAGGGGGAGVDGGGGGAGGLLSNTISFTPGSVITVTVGAGGVGTYYLGTASRGENSNISGFFGTVTTIGGGGGKWSSSPAADGGSGGGGFDGSAGGKGVYPGSTFLSQPRQGYDGGNSTPGGLPTTSGGGGGGAGGIGGNGSSATGGNGGIGLDWNSLGTYYSGGGGGGGNDTQGTGGLGGGGNSIKDGVGGVGGTNTGGGGGSVSGTSFATPLAGGNGGSGIVILRWPTSDNNATANTGSNVLYTNTGGYHTYRFYSSGTLTI